MEPFFQRLIDMASRLRWRLPPAAPQDPYASVVAPVKPRPNDRSGAVAVAEPDDDR